MTTTSTKPATTYAAAYTTLAAIADRLKGTGNAAAIDALAEDVRAARAAYDTCRTRLAAIRAEIDTEMAGVGESTT